MTIIVLVDVDDVITQSVKRWLELYNNDFDDNLNIEDINIWDIASFAKKCDKKTFFDYIANPNFYDKVEPIDGSWYGVTRLREMGYRVVFATSPTIGHEGRKFQYLCDYGYLDNTHVGKMDYIEATDKSLIQCDYMVDDSPNNILNTDGMPIIFDRPWNRHLKTEDGFIRANDWDDVVSWIQEK